MTVPAATTLRRSLTLVALLGLGTLSQAQVYRSTGPDGRPVYSDRPPAASTAPRATGNASAGGRDASALPYELRQTASRYPVTLYTGSDCAPCDNGRALLTRRGIPFEERTVNTAQDLESMRRLSPDTSLPMLAIGSQKLSGFSSAEWSQYLDLAGYPKASQLPSSYRRPPAAPLVQVQAPPAAAAAPVPPPAPVRTMPAATPPTPSNAPNPNNPAGIRF